MKLLVVLALFAAAAAAALADDANDAAAPCRAAYVVPYAEQCDFAYASLRAGAKAQAFSQAFDACARAQDAALSCVKSGDRAQHAIALTALYRAVTLQGDIAMQVRQFRVAEALLRERLDVIRIVAKEARPGDTTAARERAAAQRALAQSKAGECTERALASAGRQFELGKAHRYADLAAMLKKKYDDYVACERLVPLPEDRAYVRYAALVALEESGRAAQAAGNRDEAATTYQTCIDGAERAARDATSRVKGYLATVEALCRGRKDGTYAVDQPEPIGATDAKSARPLALPTKR